MHLKDLNFPVFKLGTVKPLVEGNVTLYITKKNEIEIVDDKGIPGETLAARRLILKADDTPLAKIHTAIFFLGDLIRHATPDSWFIDSAGKLFQYHKRHRVRLVSKRITRVIREPGAILLEVEGIHFRIRCLYPPTVEQKYVSLLQNGQTYILYGFTNKKHEDTYRKI